MNNDPRWDSIVAKLTEDELEWLITRERNAGARFGWNNASARAVKIVMDAAKVNFESGRDRDADFLRSVSNKMNETLKSEAP